MQYYGSIEYTMAQSLRSVLLSPPSQSLLELPSMKAIECTINWTALLEDLGQCRMSMSTNESLAQTDMTCLHSVKYSLSHLQKTELSLPHLRIVQTIKVI